MDLTLDTREREMIATGRKLFQQLLDDPVRGQLEDAQDEGLLREVMSAVGRDGWMAAPGPDAPLFERTAFFSAAGEALAPGLLSNAIAGAGLLAAAGSAERRDSVERGQRLVTINSCRLEPASPGARASIELEPTPGGGMRVVGTCELVEYGSVADVLLLILEAHRPADRLAMAIDLDRQGVRRRPRATFGADFRADLLLDIEVPAGDLLTADDLGEGPVPEAVGMRTAIRLVECAAGARAVTRRTIDYVNTRHQFGKPLAQFQAVKQHAADMLILSEGAFLLAAEAIADYSVEGACAPAVWRAASWVPHASKEVTLWAHQLHGGIGYARESHLFRWSERAKLRELEIEGLLSPAVTAAGLGAL